MRCAVLALRAPRVHERAHLRQPQREVVLGGVADRAVYLQAGARGPIGRVAARHLRGRDIARESRVSAAPKSSGRANSSPTCTSASRCFTAWNPPIGLPNCVRCLAYSTDRSSNADPGPEQLRGCCERAEVERARSVDLADRFGSAHLGEASGRVEGRDRAGHGRGRERRAVEQVDRVADSASSAYGTTGGAAIVAIAALVVTSERRQDGDRLDVRAGHGGPSQLLERQHQVDRRRAESAVRSEAEGEHALLGQPRPQLASGCVVAGRPRSRNSRNVRRGKQIAERRRELALLGDGSKPHRGSPSSRSATTLRWISFVPA